VACVLKVVTVACECPETLKQREVIHLRKQTCCGLGALARPPGAGHMGRP
jgi:hypothetical protein